jgi:glycosyltransferase involved in cell wall biosynthesis
MENKKLVIGITAPQSTMLLKGQLRYFVNKGYDVYLLAPKDKQTIDICNKEGGQLLPISIKRVISPLHDLRTLFQIVRVFNKIKPDIINLGTPKVSLLGMIAAKIIGIEKRVYTCRGFRFEHETGFLKYILVNAEKITASFSTKILCISPSVRQIGIKHKIFKHDKTTVINKGSSNGLDLSLFSRDDLDNIKLEGLKQTYELKDQFVFGFLGRIVERKGFKELIKAFDKIYQKEVNVRLLVVGRPYYDQIGRDIVDKANKHPGIAMTGLVDYEETPYYYSLMDVFVLPAYWEGFGNVLTQSAAMGLPIISTNVTGCKDAVSDGFNGTLIEEKNIGALYNTMLYFKNNSNLLRKYSENGLEWVKNFKPEIIWDGMAKLYKE